jgi:hypothetical protein
VSQRRSTIFRDIINAQREEGGDPQYERNAEATAPVSIRTAKVNKATDKTYTKLTAYIPRTLASAIKMTMALEGTTDQSDYIEKAIADWLKQKGRGHLLDQAGYPPH